MPKAERHAFVIVVAIVGCYVLLTILTYCDCRVTSAKIDSVTRVQVTGLELSLPALHGTP